MNVSSLFIILMNKHHNFAKVFAELTAMYYDDRERVTFVQ